MNAVKQGFNETMISDLGLDGQAWLLSCPALAIVHPNLKTIYNSFTNYCLSRLEGLSINNCTASFATHKSQTRRSKIAIFQHYLLLIPYTSSMLHETILFLAPPHKTMCLHF